MNARAMAVMLSIIVMTSTEVVAQSKRPPLGPGISNQFPDGLQRQAPVVDADSITVSNFGSQRLRFSAWDGASTWRPFDLLPGQTVTVACEKCGDAIPIAFHDGVQNRTTRAKAADRYGLYWDDAQRRWNFAPVTAITSGRGR